MRILVKAIYCICAIGLWCVIDSYLAVMLLVGPTQMRFQHVTPITFLEYWYAYHADPIYAFKLKESLSRATVGLAIFTVIAISLLTRKRRSLYGDARFANKAEIGRAGLLGHDGIVVGKVGNKYLMFPGQQFVMLSAPTRSGKGVGVVIPNLLNFRDSVVVLDIKQENFNVTAGFRAAHGQQVFLFNPFSTDGQTHRYNPLTYISEDPVLRIGDILTVGTILFPPEGKDGSGKDAFWYEQARNLFLGIVLLILETPELPRTLGEVLRQASGFGKRLHEHLNAVISVRHTEGRPLSATCIEALYRFLDNAETTYAGILSTFNSALTNWANPIFDAATSESDFLLTDVRRNRMSIYVGITPDKLPDAASLLNVFFAQLLTLNMKELPQANPELRYQCLILMDEFTSIGKLNIFSKSISFMAGYNLRMLPIIQSVSQLTAVYGEHDARTLMTNHAMQILFAPREQKDASEYSEMLGYLTQKNSSANRPVGFSQKGASRSDTISDQKRALLLPQELRELGKDKEIIMLENCKPILAEKICYYQDPAFSRRLYSPPMVERMDFNRYLSSVEFSRNYNARYVIPGPPAAPAAPVGSQPAQASSPPTGMPSVLPPIMPAPAVAPPANFGLENNGMSDVDALPSEKMDKAQP